TGGGATRCRTFAVDAVRVRRRASRLPAADDRSHRTPEAHRADAPQRIKIRPRRGPLAHEEVTEATLQTDRRVPRRRLDGLVRGALQRSVLLDLHPTRQAAAEVLPAAHAVVGRAVRDVPLAGAGANGG